MNRYRICIIFLGIRFFGLIFTEEIYMATIDSEKNTKTILVVDDDQYILDVVKEQLFHLGHEVITACCGKDALQKAKEFTGIDLLLTDIMMPSMNGIELAKEFIKLLPKVKIVFM